MQNSGNGGLNSDHFIFLSSVKACGGKDMKKRKKSNEYISPNPMMGKKVIFVANENDKENADGIKGHLEAIGCSDFEPAFYCRYIKRVVDIILSIGGLLVLSPVFLVISLAIVIDDPGPVFFKQKRIGRNKEYFMLYKFRSMKMATPHDVPTHMLDNPEQYITTVGKFLRAHSLDELPQIWNILVGNMSVIGPRPALWNQDVLVAERDKYNANDIMPGLTGWAQINGRDELELSEKARLDGEYVQKQSLLFDIKCFFGTIFKIVKDDSVVEGGTGELAKAERSFLEEKTEEEIIGHIGFGEIVELDFEKKKKVLITGAGSYIGEYFKEYAQKKYGKNFTIDEVDMLDASWRDVDFSLYDVVYHVAGIAHADVGKVSEEIKQRYYSINTDLAIEVCEKSKREGVKEFVFMSSMIVYGESAPYGKQRIITEQTVPKAANFYGDSKLQADMRVRDLASTDFKVLVLRPPMVYGRNSKGNYPVLAKLAKKLPIFPKVENKRSMLYIDNLCEFLCQLLLVRNYKENAIVFFPQNDEWVTTAEMVKEISLAKKKKIRLISGLNLFVMIGSKIPGKIETLVNKAFGNYCYEKEISKYAGIDYQGINLKDSIHISEGEE